MRPNAARFLENHHFCSTFKMLNFILE